MKRKSKGIEYIRFDAGNCFLKTAAKCKDADVIIPEKVLFKGVVKAIDREAFRKNIKLKSIVIPDGVEHIGRFAFASCKNLERISLSGALKTIGEGAFYKCEALTDIKVGGSLEKLYATSFAESGYWKCRENWKDGLLYLGKWVIGCNGQYDEYVISPDTVGIAADVFVEEQHVKRTKNEEYDRALELFNVAM